ncbi:MAG: hypothetical protein ABII07_01375 [Patescibacteria group bacterium]
MTLSNAEAPKSPSWGDVFTELESLMAREGDLFVQATCPVGQCRLEFDPDAVRILNAHDQLIGTVTQEALIPEQCLDQKYLAGVLAMNFPEVGTLVSQLT